MNNALHTRSPRALTAIAAVLALSATPAIAQEAAPITAPAAPVVIQPEAQPEATAPAPAPVAAQPTVVTTSAPVVQPVPAEPEAAAPEAKPAAPAPARRTAAARPAPVPARAATPAAAREAPAPAVPVAPSQPPAQRAAPAPSALADGPAPAPAPVAPAAQPAATSSDTALPVAGIVGLLAALGIAGLGIAALRSRRRARQDEWDYAEEPATAPEVAYAPAPTPVPVAMESMLLEPALEERGVPAAAAPLSSVSASHSGAAAILRATPLPETPEERHDLLERMVAAQPDEDNPFHTHKSRLRRARLMLQHHEHLAQEAAARGEPFDFRTYKPSTTFSTSAKTELVDS